MWTAGRIGVGCYAANPACLYPVSVTARVCVHSNKSPRDGRTCPPVVLHLLIAVAFAAAFTFTFPFLLLLFFFAMIALSVLSAAALIPLVFAARDPPVFTLDCSSATGYPEACETHWHVTSLSFLASVPLHLS